MNQLSVVQGTITTSPFQVHQEYAQDTHLLTWIEAFLLDRKAQNMAKGTLQFYQKKMRLFVEFCDSQAVTQIDQLDPGLLRQYLLWLEEKGHNPGGCHAAYRTVKTFLRWWEQEVEPVHWKNPIQKVKAPKVALEPLEPVSMDTVRSLIDASPKDTLAGARDRAIFLCLLDTGARASEFINIDLADINPITGQILIREGKGRKPRTVFIGQKCRKALRQYLRLRKDNFPAL
jgi:site-specific recombinase XerD